MNKVFLLLIPLALIVVAGYALTRNNQNTPKTQAVPTASPTYIEQEIPISASLSVEVPLPQPQDIIRTYFNLVNEKRIAEAVGMMTNTITADESTKQAWGVQLAALSDITINKIEPSMPQDWTDTTQTYKVDMTLTVDPKSASEPIPYFGYDTGRNIRFISLQKEVNLWKIAGIGTGP
jgi:hypothetical protein